MVGEGYKPKPSNPEAGGHGVWYVVKSLEFSSIISKEGKWYVANCPELEIASQGESVQSALNNLREAIELYLEDENGKATPFTGRASQKSRVFRA
jgi:predicted RNase H-like HicB family nuclease